MLGDYTKSKILVIFGVRATVECLRLDLWLECRLQVFHRPGQDMSRRLVPTMLQVLVRNIRLIIASIVFSKFTKLKFECIRHTVQVIRQLRRAIAQLVLATTLQVHVSCLLRFF